MESAGFWTMIFTAVIAVATVAYVVGTLMLWRATLLTASRTEELARQSADALKVQIVATYFQVRAVIAAEQGAGRFGFLGARTSTSQLQQLFEKVIPGLWAELDPILFPPAKEPQQHSPNAGTTPRRRFLEEELP